MKKLFELNPALDRAALARRFAATGRVQIRDVLTEETAREILAVLTRGTPWGMAIGAGETTPQSFRMEEARTPQGQQQVNAAAMAAQEHSARGEYGFRFAHYPILTALQERWDPDGPHEVLLEHLNAPEFMALARDVTGIESLFKADGQATLFAPNHYLGRHIDSHVAEGWEVAYVLNFARDDWHPDWGGYLLFLDEDDDVVEGFRPRFNALNLFKVPQSHLVSYVPPFAPMGRIAVTGWLRSK
ncbi:2OG-Fe(II) oxygenase family protein [Erythrobacter sp. JK5]|uniref:2OG-Fe(II) oxygenase n=1 Tax=Erythrobacter sp. JK5 TaxID=2829500 RepID=UPI001BA98AA0|nr:2OG-Fe(II) oxygenase family protein [Erythrobacter sp. JK5]QUL36607.1 2OG-Fe(II) oxygenase [Erythrobacter sp. JK5]